MRDIVAHAPKGFGAKPDAYRYDVLFLKNPLTAPTAMKSVPVKEGVDQVHAGTGVLYFSRLIEKASQAAIERYNPELSSAMKKLKRAGADRDPNQAQRAISTLTADERKVVEAVLREVG